MGGGDEGPDPIEIPTSVDANPDFASLESDFLDAVNQERTDHAADAFAATTASVDALARRYASVGQCDTSGTSVAVTTAMNTWLSQSGGTAAMRNSGFIKIGIGMAEIAAVGGAPGESWVCVVVLLAKP